MTCQIFLLALQKDTLAAAKLYDNIGHLYIYESFSVVRLSHQKYHISEA